MCSVVIFTPKTAKIRSRIFNDHSGKSLQWKPKYSRIYQTCLLVTFTSNLRGQHMLPFALIAYIIAAHLPVFRHEVC